MKDRIFGVLQRVGRSVMIPIAIVPVAGLLLGIGSSFTNATTIETICLNCRGICKVTSDSQQKTCYRKNRNWEHKAPSHSLQDTENPVFHVTSLLLFP